MGALDLKEELIAAFPPGIEEVIDWEDDPGKLLEAIAFVLKEHGTDLVEKLRLELNPATAQQKLVDWEQATGLEQTAIAQTGTSSQRQQQLISRLREIGPTTLANIRAVLQPLFQYADTAQMKILEVDRMVLRAMHTYSWKGALRLSSITNQILSWTVLDGAAISQTGAQIDLTIDTFAVETIWVILLTPDGKAFPKVDLGQGSLKGIIRVYFKECAGLSIGGTWTLILRGINGSMLTQADLFVEGMGRTENWVEGRGGTKFHWGVMAEEEKLGKQGPSDLKAAQHAISRMNYARSQGGLILRSKGIGKLPPGQFAAIPDDPNSIPDMCIPG